MASLTTSTRFANTPYVPYPCLAQIPSAALHERFGFKAVGVFSEKRYKFDRYWDVCWMERPLKTPGTH